MDHFDNRSTKMGDKSCDCPRVPDVSTDKVLGLLMTGRTIQLIGDSIGWFVVLPDGPEMEYADTPELAACAALLEA